MLILLMWWNLLSVLCWCCHYCSCLQVLQGISLSKENVLELFFGSKKSLISLMPQCGQNYGSYVYRSEGTQHSAHWEDPAQWTLAAKKTSKLVGIVMDNVPRPTTNDIDWSLRIVFCDCQLWQMLSWSWAWGDARRVNSRIKGELVLLG